MWSRSGKHGRLGSLKVVSVLCVFGPSLFGYKTTMACHVYNHAYYKMMTIVIHDMQSKDIRVEQIMWTKFYETMLKNEFPKPKFKGFMTDNAQTNWKLSKLLMVMGTFLSRWLIKSAHVYSIRLNCLIGTPNSQSSLSCKISTKVFATNTRMQNP